MGTVACLWALLASTTDLLSQSPEQPQPPAAPQAFDRYEAQRRPGLATKVRSAVPVVSFDSPQYASTNTAPPPPYGTEFRLLDLSLSFEFHELLVVEAGGSLVVADVGPRGVGYSRVGPLANLHRGPKWTVNFQPLLGVQYRGKAGDSGSSTLMGVPMAAIDATRWWPNGWGLTIRVRAGYDFRLASWGSNTTVVYGGSEGMPTYHSDDLQSAVEFGVDLGVAARR